ncbi:hypothetical protein AB1Y20_022994 [Prymnesium parvum]|uniref:ShKT domain-containing protein n=1 Tax=Prymnesium parvum TaxID=97485 RepID=A0AB34JF44_PRYPA
MRALLLLIVLSAAEDACDLSADFPIAPPLAQESEAALRAQRLCFDRESCICAAMRFHWHATARALVSSREGGQQLHRARRLAEARKENASHLLARLHPRYPYHVKLPPALLWAQDRERLHVRVRYARYATGEPICRAVEAVNLTLSTEGLFFSAESTEKPAYFELALRWAHPLMPAGGAACPLDSHQLCGEWAANGECDRNPPFMHERCARACGRCAPPLASGPVEAAWTLADGGLVVEAKKLSPALWNQSATLGPARTASTKQIAYAAELEGTVGELQECHERCAAASTNPEAGLDQSHARGGSTTDVREPPPQDERSCQQRCLDRLVDISSSRTNKRPPRVSNGRLAG